MTNLSQITPALIGFFTVAIIIISIRNYKFIQAYILKEELIFSLIFISSGFIFQLIFNSRKQISYFAEQYKGLFTLPPVTVISTILAIFLGNTLLRKLADRKERREIAVLFENTIDTQSNISITAGSRPEEK